ncbi:MAG: bifunctional 5,10-methylenetetrahydrofolate dehydrogenase/5,10-methenyltetrahydrofolate cyclohydrolase [bacterium]
MTIIDGKSLAEKIKDQIAKEIYNLRKPRPNLAIVLVGDREDSCLYVNLKEKQAKTIGIDTHLYKCEADISEKKLLQTINYLNKDKEINAILVQLPLPKHINTKKIIQAIDPNKDIDGFHSENLKHLCKQTDGFKIIPPVYGVILEILKSINYDLSNKQVCIIANADIFEENLAELLNSMNAKVVLAKVNDSDLKEKTSQADVLITAVGKPGYITKDMVKQGSVVIDIGITKVNGQIKGDVNFDDVKDKVGYITPVPGGVGPMTIAMAFKNTLGVCNKCKCQKTNLI